MEPLECPPTPLHLPPDGGESPKSLSVGSPSPSRKRLRSPQGGSTSGMGSPLSHRAAQTPTQPNSSPMAGSSGEGQSTDIKNKREPSESPEPNCAICLGKLENKSFTDSCFHQFCFTCLLEWSKVKAECPLCKQTFKSIIHSVRSIEDYDQYHLRQGPPPPPQDMAPRWPLFTTDNNYAMHLRSLMLREPYLPPHRPPHHLPPHRRPHHPSSWLRSGSSVTGGGWRGHSATSTFREMIYADGLWVRPMADITGRYRECSPNFYRVNPACTHRLMPWLNRELNALIAYRGGSQVMYVMDLVSELVRRVDIGSPEFREHLTPYLGSRTDHFVHEFRCFARAPYDMAGYDQYAQYEARPEPTVQDLYSTSDSDDSSDVLVLSPEPQRPRSPGIPLEEPLDLAVPGPSGLAPLGARGLAAPVASGVAETRVKEESDSDDCRIVACLKPIGERTPEIVTVSSESVAPSDTDSEEVPRPKLLSRHHRRRRQELDSDWSHSTSGSEVVPPLHRLRKSHSARRVAMSSSSSSEDSEEAQLGGGRPQLGKRRRPKAKRRSCSGGGSSSGSGSREEATHHTVSMVNVEQTRIRISSVVTRPGGTSTKATFALAGASSATQENKDNNSSDSGVGGGSHRKHRKKHKKDKRKAGKGKSHKSSGKGKGKSKK